MDIKTDRLIAARECGLTLDERCVRYLKPTPEDENCPKRFYCNKVDWKPDENWAQLMYLAFNCKVLEGKTILPSNTPKGAFIELMHTVKK